MYCLDHRLFSRHNKTAFGKFMNAWSMVDEDGTPDESTAFVASKKSSKPLVRAKSVAKGSESRMLIRQEMMQMPNFAHFNLEYLETLSRKGVTHTNLAGAAWKISCSAGNQLFLTEYAKAVASDWMNRFHPVRDARLSRDLAQYRIQQQKILNPDIMDLDDHSRDSVSTIPTSQGNILGISHDLQNCDSLPPWPTTSAATFGMQSLPSIDIATSASSLLSRGNISLHHSANISPPIVLSQPPSFLCMGEIASPACFKLFFDLDTFWACGELCDDDLALISIIFQVIQASMRLFFPKMTDAEWEDFGEIAARRTELRPEIRSEKEYRAAWDEGLSRIEATKDAPSHMYILAKRRAGSKSMRASMDDSDDGKSVASSTASRMTQASLWQSDSSSSSSSSSEASLAPSEQSRTLESLIQDLLNGASNTSSTETQANNLLAQYSAPSTSGQRRASSRSRSKRSRDIPQCSGKTQDYYADSDATIAAARAQLSSKRFFTPYKLGMNAHFPNILITAEQAKFIREYVVLQIVTKVMMRSDLLRHCRLLVHGKGLVKLADYSFDSTLAYWNNSVVDVKVYGIGSQGPHCRMIFSRKISKCRQCADYDAAGATETSGKRMASGMQKTAKSVDCPTCGGTGKADEGPDAVSHGMFAIKGNGMVINSRIESCLDVSKRPRCTATTRALQANPIRISNFARANENHGSSCANSTTPQSISISCVWTPCVRWLPKNSVNVEKLAEEWVKLTSIRYCPNMTLANGDIPPESLTPGFVAPPCWCHLFDETLTKGKSKSNDLLQRHISSGYSHDDTPSSSSAVGLFQIALSAKSASRPVLESSTSSHVANASFDAHGHTSHHESLALVLQSNQNVRNSAIESYSGIEGPKPLSIPKNRYGLKDAYIRQQLQDLIRNAQPHYWRLLNFDVPILVLKPWRLDDTLPKSQLGPHMFEHYEGAEKAAIRYDGVCWSLTCSGASVHNCLIKGSPHTSSCIHFRVTPTHIFQLCYSRSSCQCVKKFAIVCQVPPALSRLLFATN